MERKVSPDVQTNAKISRSESEIKSQTEAQITAEEKINVYQRYHLVSMFHFHLAAVINPSTDIALLSTIPTSSIFGRSFQLQWLNNKEVQLTTAVEAMFASLKTNTDSEADLDATESDPFSLVDVNDEEMIFPDDAEDNHSKTLDRTLDEGKYEVFCFVLCTYVLVKGVKHLA